MITARFVVPFVAGAMLALAPGIAAADPDPDPVNGRTLYLANCGTSSCHTSAPPQVTRNAAGGKPDVIQGVIATVPQMMNIASLKTLTFSQLADIAAYILQLRGPPAINYQGLWWAASGTESGWGVNFVHQGDQVFATWYTYDTSGNAWWLSMLAGRTSSTGSTYTGTIFQTTGSPFNAQPFPPVTPAANLPVGTGTVSFSGYNTGSFSYTVNGVTQTKAIARFILDPTSQDPTCTYASAPNLAGAVNYQDLWWVPSESGWGVNFSHQNGLLFATWYTYDAKNTGISNPPLWLSALLLQQGTTSVYTGTINRTSGPRFDDYKTPFATQSVGTMTVTFTDGNHATFAYNINAAGGLPATTQSKSITRFLFAGPAGTTCK